MTDESTPTLSKIASLHMIARAAIFEYPKEHELMGHSAASRE